VFALNENEIRLLRRKEDARVVGEVLAGETENFRFLVERYQRFAIGLAFGMVSNEAAANDVAQESFVKAFEKLNKLEDPMKFHSWLYGIIKNTSFGYLRNLKKRGISLDSLIEKSGAILDNSESSADDLMIREQTNLTIRKAIDSLGDKYRDVIMLFHFYSKSYEEIGAILGLEHKGVDSRLRRARLQLKEKLKGIVNE